MQPGSFSQEIQTYLFIAGGLGAALLIASLYTAYFGKFGQVFWRSIKFVSSLFAVASVVIFLFNFEKAVKSAKFAAEMNQQQVAAKFLSTASSTVALSCNVLRVISEVSDLCRFLDQAKYMFEKSVNNKDGLVIIPDEWRSSSLRGRSGEVARQVVSLAEQHNKKMVELKHEYTTVDPNWYVLSLYIATFFLITSVCGSAGESLFQLRSTINDNSRRAPPAIVSSTDDISAEEVTQEHKSS